MSHQRSPPRHISRGISWPAFVLTSLITNVAAVTIIFSHRSTARPASQKYRREALFLTAAFGASCCFATPCIAHQTNLMVMEAGKYGFRDFLRFGLPVSLNIMRQFFSLFAVFKFDLLMSRKASYSAT
ncbi:MAG: hypothetical protein U5L96_09010 [Owenweeksia sp.]|nr:hypothetical protein [Owenweeksia sp.]